MAAQSELGIWTERGHGAAGAHPGCAFGHGAHLIASTAGTYADAQTPPAMLDILALLIENPLSIY
jgi:hypothetical protein